VTPDELKRFGLCKIRLRRENENKPADRKMSEEQLGQRARDAVRMGVVNSSGEIVREWADTILQKSK
jgi:hypothetical protein